MKPTLAAILVAAVFLALLYTFTGSGPSNAPGERAQSESDLVDPAAGGGPLADVDLIEVEAPAAKRSTQVRAASERTPDLADHIDPARLAVRFIDADTGEDVQGVQLRGATDERFLDRTVTSPEALTLTPGRWSFAARRAPYEHAEIEPVTLRAGQAKDLGTIELRRGWGSLNCMVDVPDRIAALGPFEVRLYGEGRGACDQAEPNDDGRCIHCGRGEDETVRIALAMESFQFDWLAAGEYRALVFDNQERVLFNEHVELAMGQALRLDMRMKCVDVDFRITGPDDQPFNGEWIEDGTTFEGPIEFYFRSDGTACATAQTSARGALQFVMDMNGTVEMVQRTDRVFLRDPQVIAREEATRQIVASSLRSLAPPERVLEAGMLEAIQRAVEIQVREKSDEPPAPPELDDRLRTEEETLSFAPSSVTPEITSRPLNAKRIGPGLYRVSQVPAQADGVLLTAGPYFDDVAIDIARWSGGPIEIAFDARCASPSKMFVGGKSCFRCHGAEGVAQMVR